MSDILSKLPSFADDQLSTLAANAERLEQNGTAAQQRSATALLPAIRAEIANRLAAAGATAKAKPRARKKPA